MNAVNGRKSFDLFRQVKFTNGGWLRSTCSSLLFAKRQIGAVFLRKENKSVHGFWVKWNKNFVWKQNKRRQGSFDWKKRTENFWVQFVKFGSNILRDTFSTKLFPVRAACGFCSRIFGSKTATTWIICRLTSKTGSSCIGWWSGKKNASVNSLCSAKRRLDCVDF